MQSSEEKQLIADYIKHVNTLATGSLVLLVTFLDKLFEHPQWKILVAVALIGFLSSILGGIAVYTMTLVTRKVMPGGHEESAGDNPIGSIGLILLWAGFLVGVLALTVFALRNLYV